MRISATALGLLLALGAVPAQAAGPFDGMTAAELFPAAGNEAEATTAYDALMKADLPDARDRFAGQELTVGVLQGGPRGGISGPFYFWRTAFEQATGATLEIVEIPYSDLLSSTVTDFLTGQNTYDVLTPGAWFYGDYVSNGWIQPIDDFFDDPGYPVWDRDAVAESLKALMTWDGKWYGVLYDGDTQLLYYRKDILESPEWQAAYKAETGEDMPVPPNTWQQLLKITQFFNGKDWNGDGDPDDGISLHLKGGGFGFFHFMSLAAPFSITPATGDDPRAVTPDHNVFWFDPETMEPLINEPGNVAALEYLNQLMATGSPSQISWDLSEAWNDFLSGNAVATYSFGDIGSLSQDPGASKIQGLLGAAHIPCSETWYDREKGDFVTDAEHPNCVGNMSGGSWHGVISSFSEEPELAYYLLSMMATQPISFWNVVYGWTGVDPGSRQHLLPPDGTATIEDFVAAGFNPDDARAYNAAYAYNLFNFPISQQILRIPGAPAYWEILDTHLAEAASGQATPQEALDQVAEEWNRETDDLGRDEQLEIYRSSIGYRP